MIYHVTTVDKWTLALQEGFYSHDSLQKEQFIHACSRQQLPGVLERYYSETNNLLLLHIDETKVDVPLKYEHSRSIDELFPHIYGQLNLSAVVDTEAL